MRRTIYHLHLKATGKDHYFGSIKAITDMFDHDVLGVGIDTLYRVPWDKAKYQNDLITINKGMLHTTNSVKAASKPAKKKAVKI